MSRRWNLAEESLLLQWHGKEPIWRLAQRFHPPRTVQSVQSKARGLGLSDFHPKKGQWRQTETLETSRWVDAEHRAWMIRYQRQPEQRRQRMAQQEAVNL